LVVSNSQTLLSLQVSVSDPIVSKYIAMGLSREAVPIAVANYGDNPAKVCSLSLYYLWIYC